LARGIVGLEACGGSHFWAREIRALGHDVRLIPPAYVKPYVKRGKTDAVSALGIAASVLPGCRPVGSSLIECTLPLAGGGGADQFVKLRSR
jgi:transposase